MQKKTSSTGIILIILAMLIVPFMDGIAKLLSDRYPIFQLLWSRFFFHFLLVTPIALWRHGPSSFVTKESYLQVGRGLFLLTSLAFFWGSIKFLPLATAIALFFFNGVILVALSALILKENVSSDRWILSGLGFIGVLLIVRPGFDAFHWASMLALASSIFFALYLISNRFLAGRVPSLVALSYHSVGGFVVLTVVVPFIWIGPTVVDLLLMIGLGLIGAVGHLLIIRAFEFADASFLSPYLYVEIIMQATLGYWWFGDIPDTWTWIGIGIIVGVGLFLAIWSQTAINLKKYKASR